MTRLAVAPATSRRPSAVRRARHMLPLVILTVAVVAMAILPLAWIALTSFTPEAEIIQGPAYVPSTLTVDNYTTVWRRGDFPELMLNSLVVAGLTVALSMAVAPLAAYSLSRHRFRGRTMILILFLSIRMFPFVLMLIPAYMILRDLGLLDNPSGSRSRT